VPDVEVCEDEHGAERCPPHRKPEPALGAEEGRDGRTSEQSDARRRHDRQPDAGEDRLPRAGVEPLVERSEVPLPEGVARQPRRRRARGLDRVRVPRPQDCGEKRDGDESRGGDMGAANACRRGRGPVGEGREEPEERRGRLHQHAHEPRRERERVRQRPTSLAPGDRRPGAAHSPRRREIFHQRRASPHEGERREHERRQRREGAHASGNVADEAEEEESGEQEARKPRDAHRSVVRDAEVHDDGRCSLEQWELEGHLERLAQNGELRVEEVDAVLVVDASGERGLRLAKRVLLEQRTAECRPDVHDVGGEEGDHDRRLDQACSPALDRPHRAGIVGCPSDGVVRPAVLTDL
jgi:hypothetical protein